MRRILLALFLTLAFAGSARAQQVVRTGAQPRAAAAAPTQKRALPARAVRQAGQRALVPSGAKGAAAVRSSAKRAAPKRPAPRG